jgi:hypothetical protein
MEIALETSSCKDILTVIQLLWAKHVSLTHIHGQLIQVYGDCMLEYDAVFKNVSVDIHDDLTGLPTTSKMDLNAA